MSKVVTTFIRDLGDFAGMNEEWKRRFPTDPPARQGARHPLDVAGMLISIAVIAGRDGRLTHEDPAKRSGSCSAAWCAPVGGGSVS
jgi:hypothetical protein